MICKADIARRIVEMPLPAMRHVIIALRRIGQPEMANALSLQRDAYARECARHLHRISNASERHAS